MKLIVCLDDINAMAFHNRRQSADRVVCQKIMELVGQNNLWMNSYSGYLFAEMQGNIRIDDAFLEKAEKGDFCFAENVDLSSYLHQFCEVYVFRWNRKYPGELYFPGILTGKRIIAEFIGYSHPNIVLEAYKL